MAMSFFKSNPVSSSELSDATIAYEKERRAITSYDGLIQTQIERSSKSLKELNEDNFLLAQVDYDDLRFKNSEGINNVAIACQLGGLLKALRGRVIKDVVYENIRSHDNPVNSKGVLRVILEPKTKEEKSE